MNKTAVAKELVAIAKDLTASKPRKAASDKGWYEAAMPVVWVMMDCGERLAEKEIKPYVSAASDTLSEAMMEAVMQSNSKIKELRRWWYLQASGRTIEVVVTATMDALTSEQETAMVKEFGKKGRKP